MHLSNFWKKKKNNNVKAESFLWEVKPETKYCNCNFFGPQESTIKKKEWMKEREKKPLLTGIKLQG